jgi:hypothetical protein
MGDPTAYDPTSLAGVPASARERLDQNREGLFTRGLRCHSLTANVPCLRGFLGLDSGTVGHLVASDVPQMFRASRWCASTRHRSERAMTARARGSEEPAFDVC